MKKRQLNRTFSIIIKLIVKNNVFHMLNNLSKNLGFATIKETIGKGDEGP